MRFLTAGVTAAVLSVTATTAIAETVYECDMNRKGFGGFVGDKMFFSLVPEQSTGQVYDGVIDSTVGAPLTADVTKRNATTWQYRWLVKDVKLGNEGSAEVVMRATLRVNKGTVNVSGTLRGFDNNISGSGRCKVVK
jgi:hypothetical protein